MKIGIGYDSHRFEVGRKLKLGAIEIPSEKGLLGHSDADALIHAIIDAVLGAAALGDIGSHFPDSDAKWKDADSSFLLKLVVDEVKNAGYSIVNIDSVIITEKPKLAPYILPMRTRLAHILGIDVSAISIKGKTNEKMGSIGSGDGLAVHAVCLLDSIIQGKKGMLKGNLKDAGVTIITTEDIKKYGINAMAEKAFNIASNGTNGIHISYDLDCIDCDIAPGVSIPVKNGINLEEAYGFVDCMIENKEKIKSIDLVEFNPLRDKEKITEKIATNILNKIIENF